MALNEGTGASKQVIGSLYLSPAASNPNGARYGQDLVRGVKIKRRHVRWEIIEGTAIDRSQDVPYFEPGDACKSTRSDVGQNETPQFLESPSPSANVGVTVCAFAPKATRCTCPYRRRFS